MRLNISKRKIYSEIDLSHKTGKLSNNLTYKLNEFFQNNKSKSPEGEKIKMVTK